jgi:hypothetical protein
MTAPAQALRVRDRNDIRQIAGAAVVSGEVHQLANGLAGYKKGLTSAAINDAVAYESWGQVTLPKAANICLLDGGRAYWDHTNQVVTFKRTSARDFLLGSIVGDAAAADASCTVNLNEHPYYDLDLYRDRVTVTPVLTAGAPSFSNKIFLLDNTNEAEKIDAINVDGFSTGSKCIIEAAINVTADDSSTHAIFSIGAASGTHATAFTSITNSIGIQVKAHDTKIYAESVTAATTVAPTDTTKTYTAGTRFEVWIDLRNSSAPAIYVNGVRVLAATVFDVHTSAVDWFLIAHLVKTATTDTMQVAVDWLRARQMEQ